MESSVNEVFIFCVKKKLFPSSCYESQSNSELTAEYEITLQKTILFDFRPHSR